MPFFFVAISSARTKTAISGKFVHTVLHVATYRVDDYKAWFWEQVDRGRLESAEVLHVLIAPKICEIKPRLNDPTGAAPSPLPFLYGGTRLFTQTLTWNKYKRQHHSGFVGLKTINIKHTKNNNKTLNWPPLFPSLWTFRLIYIYIILIL